MRQRPSGWKIYGIPTAIGALTLFGLLSALLGTGLWHLLAWGALWVPLWLIVRSLLF